MLINSIPKIITDKIWHKMKMLINSIPNKRIIIIWYYKIYNYKCKPMDKKFNSSVPVSKNNKNMGIVNCQHFMKGIWDRHSDIWYLDKRFDVPHNSAAICIYENTFQHPSVFRCQGPRTSELIFSLSSYLTCVSMTQYGDVI